MNEEEYIVLYFRKELIKITMLVCEIGYIMNLVGAKDLLLIGNELIDEKQIKSTFIKITNKRDYYVKKMSYDEGLALCKELSEKYNGYTFLLFKFEENINKFKENIIKNINDIITLREII